MKQAGAPPLSFQCICTREDVGADQPDPALYIQAVRCLGVDPSEAVALEDSPNGALAAKRAGLKCIVVPNSVTRRFQFGDVDCAWIPWRSWI